MRERKSKGRYTNVKGKLKEKANARFIHVKGKVRAGCERKNESSMYTCEKKSG